MSHPGLLSAAALAFGIAVSAGLALPAVAASPVTVTFKSDSPWAQEVAALSRDDVSHDYSVAVGADKTFQVNLVTRDPNVFFKVRDETQGKDMVDTYKTGATTWSTTTTSPTTYLIHVYVFRGAIQRGEHAKYALQIGRYGKSDMTPATTNVEFAANSPWAEQVGTLDAAGPAHDYTIAVAAGQTLAVNFVTNNPNVHFKVEDKTRNQTLVDNASNPVTKWSTPVDTAATYTVSVYADPATLPPGSRAGYTLQIGHYAQTGNAAATEPAAAGTSGT
ncbi:MAG TPA: hypothetical protein VF292_06990 [Rhodanobacteraceae bacterium]